MPRKIQRWEMEHGNDNRIEKLFDDLTALKGQNNAYVLKLKAVWYIHKKEFERAEDLLQKVLIKNGNDQEAGINMAIIEIGTQHMEEAYQRLKKLQTIYPENLRIVEIMQNMKPMLNKTHTHHLNRNKKS
jgi:predicted Zn-dependent protease